MNIPIQIIKAFQKREGEIPDFKEFCLNISEFYSDTIQGEGIYTGHPAAFLRLQGCPLGCSYCDSTEVWRTGNPYLFTELFPMMEKVNLIDKFGQGHHLVITGGSPLLQQNRIVSFLIEFVKKYKFLPFLEIENECIFLPDDSLFAVINCWNNSPKLSSSGVKKRRRYKPEIIKKMSSISNSWFKFVIGSQEDWQEIEMDFLDPELIKKEQIILMPLASSRKELFENQEMVIEIAINHSVKYSSREHIVLWDKNVGV